MLDGTVFRAPIVVKGIEPCVKNWKKPITLARHAYGDVYKNTEMVIPGPGKVELVYTAADGTEQRELVHEFKGPGIAQGMRALREAALTMRSIRTRICGSRQRIQSPKNMTTRSRIFLRRSTRKNIKRNLRQRESHTSIL